MLKILSGTMYNMIGFFIKVSTMLLPALALEAIIDLVALVGYIVLEVIMIIELIRVNIL